MPSKNVSKTAKEKVSKAIDQAKDTLKMLESYKALVKLPKPEEVINPKVLRANLQKLGLATQDEVVALRSRVDALEAKLAAQEQAKTSTTTETTA